MIRKVIIQLMAWGLIVGHCYAMEAPTAQQADIEDCWQQSVNFCGTCLDRSLNGIGDALQDATSDNRQVDDLYQIFVTHLARLYKANHLKIMDVCELCDNLMSAAQGYIDIYEGETGQVTADIIATLIRANAILNDAIPTKMQIKDALLYDIRSKAPESDLGLELSASYSPKSNGDCELRNPLDIFYDQQQVNPRVLF